MLNAAESDLHSRAGSEVVIGFRDVRLLLRAQVKVYDLP